MIRQMIIPTLGLDMEGALIQRWLKAEGERVARDEPLVVVETDKATTEINAPAEGVLKQILEPEGATVPVTRPIALIQTAEAGEQTAALPDEPNGRGSIPAADVLAPTVANPASSTGTLRASPAARKIAREMGVELALVEGTGPGGRIQGDDVRRFAEARHGPAHPVSPPPPEPAAGAGPRSAPTLDGGLPGRLVPLSRKRRLTAERMALSAATVARLTINMDVDAGEMIRLHSRLLPVFERRNGTRLSYNDLLVKVVATALSDHPYLNARWTDRGIFLVESVNVGVAVAVDDGLVVPVVRDAGGKRLEEISAELGRLVTRAREDRLSLEEITGATFTITNLGMFGVDSFTPLVNPPECAILGVGQVVERPVGQDGQIVLRPTMTLSLSFDHRVVDGAPAAQFLQRVKQLLEEPYLLL